MIHLNTDTGFVRLESWEDVLGLPKFTQDVTVDPTQLEKVIGCYDFDDEVACGLSVCRQPHARGYVVELKDGRKTNLGNRCGKVYLGTEFVFAKRRFDNAFRDQQNRETLSAIQNQMPILRERLATLRDGDAGAVWIHRFGLRLTERHRGVPDEIVTEINRLVKTRNPRVMRSRLAIKEEADRQQVAAGDEQRRGPIYIQEQVGTVEGLAALYKENNLRDLLTLGVAADLDQIDGKDVTALTSRDLSVLSRKASDFDSRFTRAEAAIAEGHKLLRRGNLAFLDFKLTDKRERLAFAEFLKELPV